MNKEKYNDNQFNQIPYAEYSSPNENWWKIFEGKKINETININS